MRLQKKYRTPKMLAGDKRLVRQWEKCARLFLQTNREEEKLGKLLAPIHKAITDPEVAARIGSALGEFSMMARFFFEKESSLREEARKKARNLRYPSIKEVRKADTNEIVRMWRRFPHSPKTKREQMIYDAVYDRMKGIKET